MLTIHREKQPDRLIRMGQAPVIIEQPVSAPIPDAPPEPVKNLQGRKKMAEEKKLGHETGVKKIHQERADKQGPIGTGAEKKPASGPSEDVKIGNQEEKANG